MRKGLWAVTAVLVIIGVAAAISRVVFADDAITRVEPVHQWIFNALHLEDPFAAQRPAEVALVDGKFASNRTLTLWHVLPGAAFLLLAPLQFSSSIRRRHVRFHRWSGRLLLPAVVASILPGMYFGILMPYGGPSEAVIIGAAGGLLLIGVCRGFLAIRRRQVARHREWMIRVFAVAIAISTVRVVGAPIDLLLTPAGVHPSTVFAISVWVAIVMTVGAAELWIRYTHCPHRT